MRYAWYLLLAMAVMVAPLSFLAHGSEDDEDPTIRLVLHPAAEPRPALKYQLLPGLLDRHPGNAAVHYGKVKAENNAFFSNKELWERIYRWLEMPLAELRTEADRETWTKSRLLEGGAFFDHLERAARCESCDWQLPIREGEFYSIPLPEIQESRSFARLLGVRARLQIAHGRFDESVRTLQSGYAQARHVANGPTLINGLVGVAICNIMSGQVREFIQQPDAPNLYWALTQLPSPLIDMRRGIEAEMHAIYLSFPEVRDLDDTPRGAGYWQESLERFWQKVAGYIDAPPMMKRPEALTLLCIRGYPIAKRGLIGRGLSIEAVEAMPVAQVCLWYTMQTYKELRDDIFKWFYVPYPKSHEGVRRADEQITESVREGREILPLAAIFLPAMSAARRADIRCDRQIAALRVIEALRLYAAGHDGKLPRDLDQIREVPIPNDPVTGRPFAYQLRRDTAILEGPPLSGKPFRFEIKMVRK